MVWGMRPVRFLETRSSGVNERPREVAISNDDDDDDGSAAAGSESGDMMKTNNEAR